MLAASDPMSLFVNNGREGSRCRRPSHRASPNLIIACGQRRKWFALTSQRKIVIINPASGPRLGIAA